MHIAQLACLPLLGAGLCAQWTLANPIPSPGNRAGHAMAADDLGNVLLFGGTATVAPLDQTWRFDGVAWTQMAPATAPSPRGLASLVYDPVRARFVLYGGWASAFSIGTASNQTWEFDGANWTQVVPPTSPPGLWKHGACFDLARNRVVVYGGARNGFAIAENATWEFNGANWTQVATAGNPGPLERPAMCFAANFGACSIRSNDRSTDRLRRPYCFAQRSTRWPPSVRRRCRASRERPRAACRSWGRSR
jgi:hypothetical protein